MYLKTDNIISAKADTYHPLSGHRHSWGLGSPHWLVGHHKHLLHMIDMLENIFQREESKMVSPGRVLLLQLGLCLLSEVLDPGLVVQLREAPVMFFFIVAKCLINIFQMFCQ